MSYQHSSYQSYQGYQTEGAARFQVGKAFFRESSRIGRDLAVLAAIAHKCQTQSLRIIDAMTGCGIRPLRYALEAEADYVWANEGNPDIHAQLAANLQPLPSERYRMTHQDANAIFFDCHQRQDFYDLIDIDSFGSPMPHLSSALWAIKLGGLLYLASTDGRATSGHAPDKSLKTYGAYARSHCAPHEQGIRLLIGLAAQQAAARGLQATPVFSYHHGEVNRVMVRVTRPTANSQWRTDFYGFVAYCHECGHFQTVVWKKLGRVKCPNGSAHSCVVSGPMWLGPLHSASELSEMYGIAQTCSTISANCLPLIETMQSESNLPPYYYPLSEIGKRGRMDIPPRDTLISQLQKNGFQATRTHFSAQAIKTDASMAECLQAARNISL